MPSLPSPLLTSAAQASYRPLSSSSEALTPRTPHSHRQSASPAKLSVQEWDGDGAEAQEEETLLPLQVMVEEEVSECRRGQWRMSLAIIAIILGCCMMVYSILPGRAPPGEVAPSSPAAPAAASSSQAELGDIEPVDVSQPLYDYSQYKQFPLSVDEYVQQCVQLPLFNFKGVLPAVPYWSRLPSPLNMDVFHPPRPAKQCKRTISYLLSPDIGLTQELSYIAVAMALARQRDASFFIVEDESRGGWGRGSWTDHFLNTSLTQSVASEPGCLPPPPNELVACPRTVRHWVLTAKTAPWHLGEGFQMAFEDPKAMNEERQRPLAAMMKRSLDFGILPASGNRQLIRFARDKLDVEFETEQSEYLGVHIRQGDRLASSWKYHKTFVPVGEYADAIVSHPSSKRNVFVASDSPTALAELSTELLSRTDEPFRLMSLATSDESILRRIASDRPYNQSEWNKRPLEERIRLTRGMLVDLALATGAWPNGREPPLATVCSYSSSACKLAVLFQGFDRSFKEGRWIDVDQKGGIDWSALGF